MQGKNIIISALVILALPLTSFSAELDSAKVELGLDYLSGRIINGYGFDCDLNFHQENNESKNNIQEAWKHESRYFFITPSFVYCKKNLLQTQARYRFQTSKYEDSGYREQYIIFSIRYRPLNSLEFDLQNLYNNNVHQNDFDMSYESSAKINGSGNNMQLGFKFLSQQGRIAANKFINKWWYHFPYANDDVPPSPLFLNSQQVNLNGSINYSYFRYERSMEKTVPDYHYSNYKHKSISMAAAYAFTEKFVIDQKLSLSNSPSNSTYQTSSRVYDHESQLYHIEVTKDNMNNDSHDYLYQTTLSYAINDDLVNQIHVYRYEHIDKTYDIYETTRKSYGGSYRSNSKSRSNLNRYSYILLYVQNTGELSTLKILSDYGNFYGHLLSRHGLKLMNSLSYTNNSNKIERVQIEIEPVSLISEKSDITAAIVNNELTMTYGLTDNCNLAYNFSISRSSFKQPYFTSLYMNNTNVKQSIGMIYFSYLFNEADENQMNWLTLTDFDYWKGPLLKKGMYNFKIDITPPRLQASSKSKNADLSTLYFAQLHSDHAISMSISSAVGLSDQVQFTINSFSESVKSTRSSYIYFDLTSTLCWQITCAARLTCIASYHNQRYNVTSYDFSSERSDRQITFNFDCLF